MSLNQNPKSAIKRYNQLIRNRLEDKVVQIKFLEEYTNLKNSIIIFYFKKDQE